MKGIILAGGTATRLMPLTKVTNKHLLPVYNKPMIFYPLKTLTDAGIKDIMIVSGRTHCGHFLELLGSGKEFGINLTYAVQEESGGIAQALGLCKNFAGENNIAVILGDNIFFDTFNFSDFREGARVYLKEVNDPQRFGVAGIDNGKLIGIIEKPKNWGGGPGLAVTGLYLYDADVFNIIRCLKPSGRGELEITDVNNEYIKQRKIDYRIVKEEWTDAGTFDSLYTASTIVRGINKWVNK